MSTELTDITEVEYRQLLLERVVLVSVWTTGSEVDAENAMAELKLLAETAGSQVLEGLIQRRGKPDPATYIGRGKVDELREVVVATGADTVICDGELAPAQLRNLEDQVKVKVIDRTALILDIFAQHAKSAEGKAQVELAQLQYLKQRLRGWGGNLSRQAGGRASGGAGIGGRGPGETKLETDRRRINSRIAKLRAALREMDTHPRDQAGRAAAAPGPVGGHRRLHQRRQVEPAQPADRRRRAGRGRAVRHPGPDHPPGQRRRRPGLHPDRHRRLRPAPAARPGRGVRLHPGGVGAGRSAGARGRRLRSRSRPARSPRSATVLAEIGAGDVPELIVLNKADRAAADSAGRAADPVPGRRSSSRPGPATASTTCGPLIESRLPRPEVEVRALVPYERGDLINRIHQSGEFITSEHTDDGTLVVARVHPSLAGELAPYAP